MTQSNLNSLKQQPLLSNLVKQYFALAALSSTVLLTACGGGGEESSAQADAPSVVANAKAEAAGWNKVAGENQQFNVTGTQNVRYGIGNQWIYKQLSGTVQCTNNFFGSDPAFGIVKQCDVSSDAAAPAPSGAPNPPAPAPAPAAPAPSTSAAGTCGISNFSQQTLALVNQFRSQPRNCGSEGNFPAAPPLAWNEALKNASVAHSADMAQNNYFSHDSRDGRKFTDRITAAGYTWIGGGENIAAGQQTLDSVMEAWKNSPGHCSNLMSASHKDIGLACVEHPNGLYGKYWTMELATPR
jgi:uncharacterized protein YkwD